MADRWAWLGEHNRANALREANGRQTGTDRVRDERALEMLAAMLAAKGPGTDHTRRYDLVIVDGVPRLVPCDVIPPSGSPPDQT